MHLSRSVVYNALALAPMLAMSLSLEAQQTKRWDHYCTIDNLRVCASLELTLTPTDSSTDVSIRAQNLEGTDGSVPWAMMFGFNNIQTTFATIAFRPFIQTLFLGAADLVVTDPAVCAQRFFGCLPNSVAQAEFFFAGLGPSVSRPAVNNGALGWTRQTIFHPAWITGCDAPATDFVSQTVAYYRTCGDGQVGFDFTIGTRMWMTDETQAVINVHTDEEEFGCTLGDANCLQSTPEPATIALVATGLSSLAAFKRRRRRAQSVD